MTVGFEVLDASDVGFNSRIKRGEKGSGLKGEVSKVSDSVGVAVGLLQPLRSDDVLVMRLLLALLILALVAKTERGEQEEGENCPEGFGTGLPPRKEKLHLGNFKENRHHSVNFVNAPNLH